MTRRGRRSREARNRRRLRLQSVFDKSAGELINLQEQFVKTEPLNGRYLIHFEVGEVLMDNRGRGTMQTHPEVFA